MKIFLMAILKNIQCFKIFHISKHSIFRNILRYKIWKRGFVTSSKLFRFTLPFSKYSIFKNIPFSRICRISKYFILQKIPYAEIFYILNYEGWGWWLVSNYFVLLFIFLSIRYLEIVHCHEYSIFKNILYFRIFHIQKYSIFWNMLYSKIWKKGFVTNNKLFRYTLPLSKYSIFRNIPFSRIFRTSEYSIFQNIPYSK